MSAGYYVANFSIINPELYGQYVSKVMPLIMKYGGKAVVAGPGTERLEGDPGNTTVILEFPSKEAAQDWYNDPDYQAIISMRHDATEGGFAVLADAFRMPGS